MNKYQLQGSVKRNKKQKDKDKTKDEPQSESARDLKIHLKGNWRSKEYRKSSHLGSMQKINMVSA